MLLLSVFLLWECHATLQIWWDWLRRHKEVKVENRPKRILLIKDDLSDFQAQVGLIQTQRLRRCTGVALTGGVCGFHSPHCNTTDILASSWGGGLERAEMKQGHRQMGSLWRRGWNEWSERHRNTHLRPDICWQRHALLTGPLGGGRGRVCVRVRDGKRLFVRMCVCVSAWNWSWECVCVWMRTCNVTRADNNLHSGAE